MEMKKCPSCEPKPITEFCKRKGSKDGLDSQCKACKRKYRIANRDKINKINKNYYVRNADKMAAKRASMEHKEARREYLAKNRQKISRSHSLYIKNRKVTDINFKMAHALRRRLSTLVRKGKVGSAIRDLGCTAEEFVAHMESLFSDGMSWHNYGRGCGKWQIDHIIPLKNFDLTDRGSFLRACHYTNLQPLWFEDHTIKTTIENRD